MEDDGRLADSSDFGRLLRRHRLNAGLSQEALAERAQVSAFAISALERGYRRKPQRATLTLLANALALSEEQREDLEATATRVTLVGRSSAVTSGPWPGSRPSNLPSALTNFVGRSAETAAVAALVKRHRLVTLVGPGGVGKTRLSLEVASHLFDAVCDGVWFVELAPLSNGEYIPATVAQALGIVLPSEGDPVENLARALKGKEMLLLFDNCEHLVEPAARAISSFLRTAPKVKVLATSRQPLGVTGEASYQVPSLVFPGKDVADLTPSDMMKPAPRRYSACARTRRSSREDP